MMSDQLWEKQINARGGLLGRKVELTFIDNKSNPETGVAVYQRLVQGGYDFIFEDGGSAMVQREVHAGRAIQEAHAGPRRLRPRPL